MSYLNTNGIKLPSLNNIKPAPEGGGVMPNLQKIISDLNPSGSAGFK